MFKLMEKMMKKITLFTLMILTSFGLLAKQQTIILSVPSMNCVTCPYTVKRALNNVEGVIDASANLETKQAVVTFDNEKISTEHLTEATTNAGYPSFIIK